MAEKKSDNTILYLGLGGIALALLTFGGVEVAKKIEQSGEIPILNLKAILNSLKKFGITNKYLQAGILATVQKESGMKPRNEFSYGGTSNSRLRTIFGTRVNDLNEDQLTALKKNDVAFFDEIYGGYYGNKSKGDGYKYRGRGFNQLTFKDIYDDIGNKIGKDLKNNPDLMLQLDTAADALAAYYVTAFKAGKASGYLKLRTGLNDANDAKDLPTAVRASVQANAGWKTDPNNAIIKQGLNEALGYADEIYSLVA